MCGIIGYTGSENSVPKLISGLAALEYRGYDSAGIAVFTEDNKTIDVIKAKGRLSFVVEKIKNLPTPLFSHCGIGHTRWATHGEPSDVNSHPHGTETVAIVHNGIIENYSVIKEYLIGKGYTFVSETDTETAAKLIDFFYNELHDPKKAIFKALEMLTGSYAFGVIYKDLPGVIYAVRKDSPLIVALAKDGNYIASDIPAVLRHTNEYYQLLEGEIAVVKQDSVVVYDSKDNVITKELQVSNLDIEAAEKCGYPHFMIKEINEEPSAVVKTLRPRIKNGLPDLGVEELDNKKLSTFKKLYIVACGTAMHAGLIGKVAIEKLVRIPVDVQIASEFRYNDPIIDKTDLVIIISQSGETADTLAALRLAKEKGAYTLSIVNVAGSSIARESDSVLYTWAGPEIAVASTKAYSVQISIMFLLSVKLALANKTISEEQGKAYISELLVDAPKAIEESIKLADQCKEVAAKYKDARDVFYIGRGMDFALSQEASLKLKEISYIHSEAYAAGELKHGTISLITDGVPVFAFATIDGLFDKMMSNIKECRARGAKVILVCKKGTVVPEGIADDIFELTPMTELFMPIPVATIFQLFAYYASLLLGCDIDKPRNLAKSVTVE
jgi:glucosamine--fructose-6-phosphate aminotransferase (isomerizing)